MCRDLSRYRVLITYPVPLGLLPYGMIKLGYECLIPIIHGPFLRANSLPLPLMPIDIDPDRIPTLLSKQLTRLQQKRPARIRMQE